MEMLMPSLLNSNEVHERTKLFFDLLESLRTSDNPVNRNLDDKLKQMAFSEKGKTDHFFRNIIDQVASLTPDHKRVRKFLIDWYSTHKALIRQSRYYSDPYNLSDDAINEVIKGFGFPYADRIVEADDKITFLQELVNFYNKKGTPRTLASVLEFFGLNNIKIYEWWIHKINNGDFVAKNKVVWPLNSNERQISLDYEYFVSEDPLWQISLAELEDYYNKSVIALPSITPYISLSGSLSLSNIYPALSVINKFAQDEFDNWSTGGTLYQPYTLSRYNLSVSFLELYLSVLYVFNYGEPEGVAALPKYMYLYYENLINDDGTPNIDSSAIMTEYNNVMKRPVTKDEQKILMAGHKDKFLGYAPDFFLDESGKWTEYLQEINPTLYTSITDELTANVDPDLILKDLFLAIDKFVYIYNFSDTYLSYVILGTAFIKSIKPVLDFFKPYRVRVKEFITLFEIRDPLGDSQLEKDELWSTANNICNNSWDQFNDDYIEQTIVVGDLISYVHRENNFDHYMMDILVVGQTELLMDNELDITDSLSVTPSEIFLDGLTTINDEIVNTEIYIELESIVHDDNILDAYMRDVLEITNTELYGNFLYDFDDESFGGLDVGPNWVIENDYAKSLMYDDNNLIPRGAAPYIIENEITNGFFESGNTSGWMDNGSMSVNNDFAPGIDGYGVTLTANFPSLPEVKAEDTVTIVSPGMEYIKITGYAKAGIVPAKISVSGSTFTKEMTAVDTVNFELMCGSYLIESDSSLTCTLSLYSATPPFNPGDNAKFDNICVYRFTPDMVYNTQRAGVRKSVKARICVGYGDLGGVVSHMDSTFPANGIVAYIQQDNFEDSARILMRKLESFVWTTLIDTPVTYVDWAYIEIRDVGHDQYALYYNDTQIGTTQTITGMNIYDRYGSMYVGGIYPSGVYGYEYEYYDDIYGTGNGMAGGIDDLEVFDYEYAYFDFTGTNASPVVDSNLINASSSWVLKDGYARLTLYDTNYVSPPGDEGTVTNLVNNGDFETGTTTGWSVVYGSIALSTTSYHGTYALEGTRGAYNFVAQSVPMSCTAGDFYLFSAACRNIDAVTPYVVLDYTNVAGIYYITFSLTTVYERRKTAGQVVTSTSALVINPGLGGEAGKKALYDSIAYYKISPSDVFAVKEMTGRKSVKAKIYVASSELLGVVSHLDDPSNPRNGIIAYYHGITGKVEMRKVVSGTWTTLVTVATAKVNWAYIEIRDVGLDTYALYYNNAKIGADQTIGGLGAYTNYGMMYVGGIYFSQSEYNTFGTYHGGIDDLTIW
jgi:hypothetical protein